MGTAMTKGRKANIQIRGPKARFEDRVCYAYRGKSTRAPHTDDPE